MPHRATTTVWQELAGAAGVWALAAGLCAAQSAEPPAVTRNAPDDGYRGIWYMNQPSGDEYVYKYSGGLGTYCAKHQPFAAYCKAAHKTFFCYGGAAKGSLRRLVHMVSLFDHTTGLVPRPTILLDKNTDDAHDNPVLSVDANGHVWVFSTSHGRGRPSFVHRGLRPYDVSAFARVAATRPEADGRRVAIDNFSYMQAWHAGEAGFVCFFTRYGWPAARTPAFMTSRDGREWSAWQRLAAIPAAATNRGRRTTREPGRPPDGRARSGSSAP